MSCPPPSVGGYLPMMGLLSSRRDCTATTCHSLARPASTVLASIQQHNHHRDVRAHPRPAASAAHCARSRRSALLGATARLAPARPLRARPVPWAAVSALPARLSASAAPQAFGSVRTYAPASSHANALLWWHKRQLVLVLQRTLRTQRMRVRSPESGLRSTPCVALSALCHGVAGSWCSAGKQIGCGPATYNGDEGADDQSACQSCPHHSFTLGERKTSLADCICEAGRYSSWADGSLACIICPAGSNCTVPGATLAELPLEEGYWPSSMFRNGVRPQLHGGCQHIHQRASEGLVGLLSSR